MVYGIAAVTDVLLSDLGARSLAQHRVRPYSEMPVWMPPTPGNEGFARFDLTREVAAGLAFRTLADTAVATLTYHRSRPPERQARLRAGLTTERRGAGRGTRPGRNERRGPGAHAVPASRRLRAGSRRLRAGRLRLRPAAACGRAAAAWSWGLSPAGGAPNRPHVARMRNT
jgi:hypothetical protein